MIQPGFMQKLYTIFCFMLCTILGRSVMAQSTIFVKLTQGNGEIIKGGSTAKGHTDEIIATAFGQENTGCTGNVAGGGGGGSACKGKMGHFIVNMVINEALPLLNKALFMGTALKSADIVFVKNSEDLFQYYTIHMETIYVTHVTNSTENNASLPNVQFELDAAKTTWTFTPQKNDGTAGTPVTFGWDAVRNTSF